MGRIKMNLDMLEEVRKQNEIAMNATEDVIGKAREDLNSMTEEVWEGEDGDMARELLGDLVYKEMPETWKHIDACHEAFKKAQKKAYESKNYCNDFPKIFSGGEPNESNQFPCSGDLLCDPASCAELKNNMAEAGKNATDLKRHIEEAESILSQLETPEAKFDYSSYTEPVKKQAQDVIDYTAKFNVALTKYESKVQDLDNTLSKELIAAAPNTGLKAFDPSCLLGGDVIHMKGEDIIDTLEAHNSIDIGGKLSDAQLENILEMLFDKKDVDVSGLSEEDLGMAFISLPEEKKKAVLMEMGYTREQIDSILESYKDRKSSAIGTAFGRTLIERITDKDGDKYHNGGDKAGWAKALGLAGIRRPGEKDYGIAKTSADKVDAASAAGGTSSKDKSAPKQKPQNKNSGNNTSSSGSSSTGTNTSSEADPYAEYKTGDSDVDKKINELFKTYGDDLSGLPESSYEEWDEVTRKALACIYEKCKEKTSNSSDDSECVERTIDNIINAESNRLFGEYGDDLSGLPDEFVIWDAPESPYEQWDVLTKAALASIYEKCMEKINDSFDNSECEKERAIAGNILHTTVDYTDECYPYVFNQEKLADFETYLNKDSVGYDMVQKLKDTKLDGLDVDVSLNYIDILIEGESISFRFRDFDNENQIVEFMSYTSEDRDINYIEWCKGNNPLELYNYDEKKYEFEVLIEKYKFEGYKLSDEEKHYIAKLFEKYYGYYDEGVILSEKEIEIQEKLLKTCVKVVESPTDGANYLYETDTEYIKDIMNKMSNLDSMAYVVLANFSKYDFNGLEGFSSKKASYDNMNFNIRSTDAGIIIEYDLDTMENDNLGPDEVTNPSLDNKTGEISYNISYYTGLKYIEKLEASDSKVFSYEYSLLPDDCDKKASIANMYMTVTNTADFDFIDRLMKTDGTYDGVFVGNPDEISSSVAMAFGKYGADLLLCADEKGGEFLEYYNAFLSKIATPEGDITKNPTSIKDNGYIEKYSVGSSLYTDACLTKVWQLTSIDKNSLYKLGSNIDYEEIIKMLNDEEEKLFKQLEYAKDNELIAFSLYCYASEAGDDTVGAEVKLADNGYGIRELNIADINIVKNSANTYTKKSDNIKEIDMYSFSELEASDANKAIIAKKLEEVINEARKDICIGIAISLVGIWNPYIGAILGGAEALSNSGSDGSNLFYQAAQATGVKSIQGAATLYSALAAYQSNLRIADVTQSYIGENPLLTAFYTTHYYDLNSENGNYYSRIDDVGVIRLIQDWSWYGLSAVYDANDDNSKAFLTRINDKRNEIIEKIYTKMDSKYTKMEIETAWNTLVDGNVSNPNTYSSIMDISPDLLIACVTQINQYTGKDVNSVQNEVNEKRSDHV